MKKEIYQPPKFLEILRIACLFFTPIFLFISVICALALGYSVMLLPWASAIIFCFIFLLAIIVAHSKKERSKSKVLSVISLTCCYFTGISFAVSLFAYAIEHIADNVKLWNLGALLLALLTSAVLSLLLHFVKIKNYLLSSLFYYVVTVSAFFGLVAGVAEHTEGNIVMISFTVYTASYIFGAIVYFIIKQSFKKFDNEEKEYIRQFD